MASSCDCQEGEAIHMNNTQTTVNKELVDYFIETLQQRAEKAPATIANVKRDLIKMLGFIEADCAGEINAESVKAYINELKSKYMETSYVSKVSSIRQFINWLNLSENPFWDMSIALSNDDFRYYSYDDIFVHSLGAVPKESREINKLIVAFIYEFYLTLSELAELKLVDYNLAAGTLKIRSLEIEASATLRADLKEYLKTTRQNHVIGELGIDDYLLVNERSNKLVLQDLRDRLTLMSLRPVYVRRSRVIHLLEAGTSSEEIETRLGIKISQVYEEFEKEPDYRLLKAYNQFHPRAGN